MFKLFPYSGNKLWFINRFKRLVKNSNTVIEPFAGSAAISLNSNTKNVYINDFDKNIFKMFNAVKNSTYEFYKHTLYSVKENFGDIKESKESYYEYRNWFNDNFFKNEQSSNDITAGIHLLILAGSVINSMLRFSKNGMNQSWGHRQFIIDKESWNHFKSLNVTLTNQNFFSDEYNKTLIIGLNKLILLFSWIHLMNFVKCLIIVDSALNNLLIQLKVKIFVRMQH